MPIEQNRKPSKQPGATGRRISRRKNEPERSQTVIIPQLSPEVLEKARRAAAAGKTPQQIEREALAAAGEGADYLGVGAMYATGTKEDAGLVTMEELKNIRRAVELPIVVIGGINKATLGNFKGMGIEGIAVVSAIAAQKDPAAAARELLTLWKS